VGLLLSTAAQAQKFDIMPMIERKFRNCRPARCSGASTRGAELGMRVRIGCHAFRATGITAYLEAGGTLENAQAMAAHESPRTTNLYDRTGDKVTLDEVERIAI
jgi:integrase